MCYTTKWILLILSLTSTLSYSTRKNYSWRSNCKLTEFKCKSGECIDEDSICDGIENCKDGTDESNCLYFPCPSYAFKCTYGACINSDLVCDGKKDCKDNSDELDFRCNEATPKPIKNCSRREFQCESGECIDDFNLCDGKPDCLDASDETVKTCSILKCPQYATRCEYGACINSNLVCNGRNDCYDGSDEKYCDGITITTSNPYIPETETVFNDEYKCGSKEIINKDMICDGKENCLDGSDESSCRFFPCPDYSFRCNYGACINSNLVCNGKSDCKDNSDEILCGGISSLKPNNNCSRTEYSCNSGECIDDFDLCDGKIHCADGSDEIAEICTRVVCPKYAFKCDYGACINTDHRCNGIFDCLDGSDEYNCNDVSLKPKPNVNTQDPNSAIQPADFSSLGLCKLPENIENGNWEIYNEETDLIPGTNYVIKYTVLTFKCNPNYTLHPDSAIGICASNGWTQIPKCLKTCPAIPTTNSMTAICTFNNNQIPCDKAIPGSQALLFCAAWYEDTNLELNPIRKCDANGNWDSPIPQCTLKQIKNKNTK